MRKIFSAFSLGCVELRNRVVMAPMTRSRAPDDIATETVALYYAQRASAGLIISEGTPISREGQGYLFNPGIFSDEQVRGWKLTTDSVHDNGGAIFAQIWHVGRVTHVSLQENGQPPVSSTDQVAKGAEAFGRDPDGKPSFVQTSKPRALSKDEIHRVAGDYANAAVNACKAGFDGVEIHGANGYLIEQFLNPTVNDRTDEYGAQTLENRIRFVIEVIDRVCEKIGSKKVGIRISPYGQLFDMQHYPDIHETYVALAKALVDRDLAYVHFMDQSGFIMNDTVIEPLGDRVMKLIQSYRELLPDTALILAGGMTLERAEKLVNEGTIDLAAFGRPFISNPDLVARLENGWELTEPDRKTFYEGGISGYIDYPPHRKN